MKIICTNEEKKALLDAFIDGTELPCVLVPMIQECANKYSSCLECLEENIKWEVTDNGKQ